MQPGATRQRRLDQEMEPMEPSQPRVVKDDPVICPSGSVHESSRKSPEVDNRGRLNNICINVSFYSFGSIRLISTLKLSIVSY